MRPCSYQWTSDPHTPTEVTATSTSRGPGVGTGRSSITISRGRTSTAARFLISGSGGHGLLVAEGLHHRLEQLPADLGALLHEGAELPVCEPVTHELARRGDRGRARALVDEGDLAEAVAAGKGRTLL